MRHLSSRAWRCSLRHRPAKSAEINILKENGDHPQVVHFENGDYISEHEGARHISLAFEVETDVDDQRRSFSTVFIDDEGKDLYAMGIPMLQNLAVPVA
ncbi:hypothetical protein NOF04DRAFT_1389904 [Fusarium oxysporum II5]|uniref:Uncharacterized protein n=1 Tax=Fusarium odoratissimum (strain NRRL 54006) TaxID=1089451 RepID=X0INS7_FUSO5|nr:uncharacterized protein FOIG_16258 [Fusarium odoratissimum NRRL 54006]EXL90507.1 hypothetical protein FOIG_16258 [Fusarium odoratissimum NRRL 54006]KAK2123351.1 hypothetical protein NOF04DRAFT_1389904 [Fusarium oxysporum II5]